MPKHGKNVPKAMDQIAQHFWEKGWCRFPVDPHIRDWVDKALPAARAAVHDPAHGQWLRCAGTWFVGVNALPNDKQGCIADGPRLKGQAIRFIGNVLRLPAFDWDRGQISVCYPGYPQPMDGETDAAFRFRRDRDAAHVDGIHGEGPKRRRFLREFHGFLLGIPLVDIPEGAAPFVVWEGSHEVVREHFRQTFANHLQSTWTDLDLTAGYQAVRRAIFESCRRVVIPAQRGETYLVHRLALHGMAPWATGTPSSPDGRMIVYFRPEIGGPNHWLNAP